VDVVVAKLQDVGVCNLRDFVRGVLWLNVRLHRVGHCHLHNATLQVMMDEAVDMISWPEGGLAVESEVGAAGAVEEEAE
jgi:hypothetical protein